MTVVSSASPLTVASSKFYSLLSNGFISKGISVADATTVYLIIRGSIDSIVNQIGIEIIDL
jgi:hypothetical protein